MTVPRAIANWILGFASFPALAGAPDPFVFVDGFEARPSPLCSVVAPGNTTVAAPQLSATLRDSFHESWLGSPAVADLQGDGTPEILAARSGLVLGWHIDGSIVFRATVTGRV